MEFTYRRQASDDFAITVAQTHLPLFGRWTAFQFTSYCDSTRHLLAFNFGLQPTKSNTKIRGNSFNATPNGILQLARGTNGHRQIFEQEIVIPHCYGQVISWTEIADAEPVAFAREFSRIILRKTEAIIETARQNIRKHISPSAFEQTIKILSDRFTKITESSLSSMLGDINWPFMLHFAGCDNEAMSVISTSLERQPWDRYSIDFNDISTIPILARREVDILHVKTFADAKATSLLAHVCGPELSMEFNKYGHITMTEHGYKFIIAPGKFVECTDPDGCTAALCIHTTSFSCNPIDEVLLSYLHIKHRVREYMDMANIHRPSEGFGIHKAKNFTGK